MIIIPEEGVQLMPFRVSDGRPNMIASTLHEDA